MGGGAEYGYRGGGGRSMIRQTTYHRLAHDLTHRGISAWMLAVLLTAFYLVLYFTEILTPVAQALGLGHKWTLYGLLYTLAIVTGGVLVIRRYRHNRYQVIRTLVVIATQVTLAFSVPLVLEFFRQPGYYFSYLWPLKMEYLTPQYLFTLPAVFIMYSVLGSFLLVPLLGLFFGKRWYCSWICGCGGLANTAGEPFRHLSSKSETSWRFERVTVYAVLVVCLLLTAMLFASWGLGDRHPNITRWAQHFQAFYGLLVVAVLSGVVGVGAYPLGGTRVWCRFFCPMAAVLGITQKFGRFRIAVKPNMCISCGLCSTYCEMGIDVRAYAQANHSFTRAACVGCGLCAEVCPRGVLRLENAPRLGAPQRLYEIQPAPGLPG
jgi:ferredoxin-type protein NapH